MLVQDAARPVVLSLLLQKALRLSSAGMDSLSAQPSTKHEDSWPVVLANSVCHQVSLLLWHAMCSKSRLLLGTEAPAMMPNGVDFFFGLFLSVASCLLCLASPSTFMRAGDETMTYRINHLILMRTCL